MTNSDHLCLLDVSECHRVGCPLPTQGAAKQSRASGHFTQSNVNLSGSPEG
jgi:hypothetical protein